MADEKNHLQQLYDVLKEQAPKRRQNANHARRFGVAMGLLNEWRTAANNVDAPNAFESTRKVWEVEEQKLRYEILQLMGLDDDEIEDGERLATLEESGPGDNVLLNQPTPEPKHTPGLRDLR